MCLCTIFCICMCVCLTAICKEKANRFQTDFQWTVWVWKHALTCLWHPSHLHRLIFGLLGASKFYSLWSHRVLGVAAAGKLLNKAILRAV